LYAEAFAAGAVLTMLADSMMPEAFQPSPDCAAISASAKLTPRWNELVRDGRVYPTVLAAIHAYRST
jgi:hypothetical protein